MRSLVKKPEKRSFSNPFSYHLLELLASMNSALLVSIDFQLLMNDVLVVCYYYGCGVIAIIVISDLSGP